MKKMIIYCVLVFATAKICNGNTQTLFGNSLVLFDVLERQLYKLDLNDSILIPIDSIGQPVNQSLLVKPKRVDSQQIAGIAAIFTGGFGLHRFFLHHTKAGLIYLGYSGIGLLLFPSLAKTLALPAGASTAFIVAPLLIPWIIGWVDSYKILSSTHDEYEEKFHHNKKLIMWLNHEKL